MILPAVCPCSHGGANLGASSSHRAALLDLMWMSLPCALYSLQLWGQQELEMGCFSFLSTHVQNLVNSEVQQPTQYDQATT